MIPRTNVIRAVGLGVVAAATAVSAAAQAPAASGALPPIRKLGAVVASSTELLTAVSQVRALPDGRVLVNDNGGRKVVMFDASLGAFTVVADTTSATANAYSSRAGGLIHYKGDSTLFVDPTSLSMLVIDGKGNVARVMSVPRPSDASALVGGANGTPAFDASGRLVYRAVGGIRMAQSAGGRAGGGAAPGAFPVPEFPDSTTLIRVDLASRTVDTVASLKIQKQNMRVNQMPNGGMSISATLNPMQYVDDWAVTSDGRVAVIRGQEYRVDFVADGKVVSSSRIPFAWRHMDDSTKTAFLDSTRTAMEKVREQAMQRMQQQGGAPIMMGPGGDGGGMGGAVTFRMETRAGGGGGDRPAPGAANGAARGNTQLSIPPIEMVGINELPDYAPPFAAGSVRGDEDGNVWIRTSNVYDGGSVYDIVNADGKLVDRVLLPPGRVIAGFGKGGVVYMGVRVNETGVRLEKATLR
jgi:hypothetical protein